MIDYSVTELNLSNRNLTELPDLSNYRNLQILYCDNNQITSLQTPMASTVPPQGGITDHLPVTLQQLRCEDNPILSNYNYPITIENNNNNNNIFRYSQEKEQPLFSNRKNRNIRIFLFFRRCKKSFQ
jgi:Leucine-rich repeat (LRR) protein